MSAIPKRIERNRNNPSGPAGEPRVTEEKSALSWEVAHESETLRPVPIHAARPGGSLRSRSRTSRVRAVRQRTKDAREVLPTRSQQERKMHNSPQCPRHGTMKRCAICGGKFGLIRYYSWRAALCSKKCVNQFRARREHGRTWLFRFQAA